LEETIMAKKSYRRGKIERHRRFSPGLITFFDIEEIKVAAWCPDDKAQLPPTQVHLVFAMKDFPAPVVLRFKSPDTLGVLIEELAHYRQEVWPDAEPLDLNPNGFSSSSPQRGELEGGDPEKSPPP
jgi:hypothetical protein